jgi:general secretion pathway protein G
MARFMVQPSPQTRHVIELVNELAAGRIDVATYYRLSAEAAKKSEESPPPDQQRSPAPRRAKLPNWRMLLGAAILIGAVLLALHRSAARSDTGGRAVAAEADLERLTTALEMFHHDIGRYPSSAEGLGVLVSTPTPLAGWRGPYLTAASTDPWGHPYLYTPAPAPAAKPTITSLGQDGVASIDDLSSGADGF